MTPDQLAHVRADVQTAMVEGRNDDPALLPDLLDYLLTALGTAATEPRLGAYCFACDGEYQVMDWASAHLVLVQLRATSGIPFAERNTDWSDHP